MFILSYDQSLSCGHFFVVYESQWQPNRANTRGGKTTLMFSGVTTCFKRPERPAPMLFVPNLTKPLLYHLLFLIHSFQNQVASLKAPELMYKRSDCHSILTGIVLFLRGALYVSHYGLCSCSNTDIFKKQTSVFHIFVQLL